MPRNFLQPLTGSFAMPAEENPTVAMIEAAFRHHGLDWRYINCAVAPEDLSDAVRGLRAMGWRGFNSSIPHKVAVIKHLDVFGQSAEIIGAVNTIVRHADGRLIGENTDGKGFVRALCEVIEPDRKRAVFFGAGGAARAVAVELTLAGATRITVVNRSRERGEALTTLIKNKIPAHAEYYGWSGTFAIPRDIDFVVNATSIGLYPDVDATPDIDHDTLASQIVVADGIHNPPLTRPLKAARARGCTKVEGLGMLVGQGENGLKYWTGIDADPYVMRRALLELDL